LKPEGLTVKEMTWPLFLIPVLAGAVAQGLKPLLNREHIDKVRIGGRKLPRYGGMPSAHTAFAFSLATLVALTEGVGTINFAIAVSLVIYVIDDALRMRIFLGKHGEALGRLIHKLPPEERTSYPFLESRLGHSQAEVLVGAIVGSGITLVLMWALRIFAA
jgi:uncharacterized protein